DTLTYDLGLTNKGPARATGGTLAVTLAAGLTPGAVTVSQGSCSTAGQIVSCAVGVLEAGLTAGLVAAHPARFWRLRSPTTSRLASDATGNGLSGAHDPGVNQGLFFKDTGTT